MKHEFLKVEKITDLFQILYTQTCVESLDLISLVNFTVYLCFHEYLFKAFYLKINVNLQIKEINKCLLVFCSAAFPYVKYIEYAILFSRSKSVTT